MRLNPVPDDPEIRRRYALDAREYLVLLRDRQKELARIGVRLKRGVQTDADVFNFGLLHNESHANVPACHTFLYCINWPFEWETSEDADETLRNYAIARGAWEQQNIERTQPRHRLVWLIDCVNLFVGEMEHVKPPQQTGRLSVDMSNLAKPFITFDGKEIHTSQEVARLFSLLQKHFVLSGPQLQQLSDGLLPAKQLGRWIDKHVPSPLTDLIIKPGAGRGYRLAPDLFAGPD